MLRSRLSSYATAGQLVVELDRTPPREIRTALVRALREPSVEVLFWSLQLDTAPDDHRRVLAVLKFLEA